MLPEKLLCIPTGPDKDLIEKGHEAYRSVNLPRSPQKGFGFSGCETFAKDGSKIVPCGIQKFLAWGTEVNSPVGTVGTPGLKRAGLVIIAARCLALGVITPELLTRIFSLVCASIYAS